MNEPRRKPFSRNQDLELLLTEINALLAPVEDGLERAGDEPRLPLVAVVGPPRSGTTLLTQWLAASGRFAYPSNLLSRFYRAPALGARIQLLLTDPRYAFRDELWELGAGDDFRSDLGKTRGALAPNEFWYFWRRFLPIREPRPLTATERAELDVIGLRAALAALERVFERPLAFKAMALMYDLPFFARALPQLFVVSLRRDPLENAASLLRARERFSGDRATWYSAWPPDREALQERSPEEQVVGQVLGTLDAIEVGMAGMDPGRQLAVDYGEFCAEPARTWSALRERLAALGSDPGSPYDGPQRFKAAGARWADAAEERALRAALERRRQEAPPRRGATG